MSYKNFVFNISIFLFYNSQYNYALKLLSIWYFYLEYFSLVMCKKLTHLSRNPRPLRASVNLNYNMTWPYISTFKYHITFNNWIISKAVLLRVRNDLVRSFVLIDQLYRLMRRHWDKYIRLFVKWIQFYSFFNDRIIITGIITKYKRIA